MVKSIHLKLNDDVHSSLKDKKEAAGNLTWEEYLINPKLKD